MYQQRGTLVIIPVCPGKEKAALVKTKQSMEQASSDREWRMLISPWTYTFIKRNNKTVISFR